MSSETYSFSCPACHATLSLPLSLAGVTGPCPYCSTEITAPHPNATLEAETWIPPFPEPHGGPPATVGHREHQYQPDPPQGPPAILPPPLPQASPDLPHWTGAPAQFPPAKSIPLPPDRTEFRPHRIPLAAAKPAKSRRGLVVGLAAAGVVVLGVTGWALRNTLFPSNPPSVPTSGTDPVAVAPPEPPTISPTRPAPATDLPGAETNAVAKVETPSPEPPPGGKELGPDVSIAKPPASDSGASPLLENGDGGSLANGGSTPPPPKTEVRPAKVVVDEPSAEPSAPSVQLPPGQLDEPRKVLESFLAAKNWKDRITLSQSGVQIRSEMETYYQQHADGPVKAESVDYLTSQPTPDKRHRFHLFEVNTGGEHGFPVAVEETEGGYLVDWRSFVEFKDLLLPKFFESFREDLGTFHVVLKRTHYFGSDVPNQDRKICFAVEPPVPGYTNYVWVEQNNDSILRKLGDRAEWGTISYPVVALRWVKEKDSAAYVTLFDIVRDNWRSEPRDTPPAAKPR